ncbi:MAG: hypothetical protein EXS12_02565 [Phycisphaerales bacterium]|nr:hypothetical protein [Phycisphaerales bacterium]
MNFKLDFNLDRNPTLARIRSLPTASRYGLIAVGILAAYIAINSWSWSWARSWNAQADHIQKILADSQRIIDDSAMTVHSGPELYGLVNPIASESEGAESMAKAVVEIVKKYSTTNFSYDAQRASTRISGLSTTGEKISKVSGELQFECSPDTFSKIVADIESNPAIESISSIRVHRKEAEKKIVVRMTVDSWVIPSKSMNSKGVG